MMKYRVRERIRWMKPKEIEEMRAKEALLIQQTTSEAAKNLSKSMSEKPIKLNTTTLMDLRDQEYMFQKEVDNREVSTIKFLEEQTTEQKIGLAERIRKLVSK